MLLGTAHHTGIESTQRIKSASNTKWNKQGNKIQKHIQFLRSTNHNSSQGSTNLNSSQGNTTS